MASNIAPGTGHAPERPSMPPTAEKTTTGEQVVLTVKILAIAILLIALLWFLDRGV